MSVITSIANPHIKAVQELHTTRGRKKSGLFLMEGPHLLLALLDAHLAPQDIYYQPELLQRTAQGSALLQRILQRTEFATTHLVEVSTRVIEALGEVQTSQGVVSVLAEQAFKAEQTRQRRPNRPRPALLILDDIADPGNMGTILRTALAADAEAVLLTPNCVDCFSPKVVRAAAGAHVALPIEVNLTWEAIRARVLEHCAATPRALLAEANSPNLYYTQDLTLPFALIMSNEAHGPSAAARALATTTITIPLANSVESLNVAIATGILLYEAFRQRQLSQA
jgi:TrmH family RNA methyltransferase